MESDLPLIEMAEEDDSLIQHFPDLDQTPCKSALNYSAFSPFSLPPSHAKLHMEKPSSSSSEAINNKENINSNSLEVPKLGMEPMQMKRRKKGAGCNLRKSLAWDRAFFTDEGILDPLELTLITGIGASTHRGLSTVSEEGNSSFSSDASCTNESNDTGASAEAPLKVSRDKNCTPKGKREKTDCLMKNYGSLLHHKKVTHKVLSSDRTNRGGPKIGGCSEPLAASSLKRPANSNTLKEAKKESKLPKLPISKQGSCLYAMTKGSMAASQLRHNLIPKPTKKIEKNFGLKSSLQNAHGSQSKAKTGSGNLHLPVNELAKKTTKILTHSFKAASSTRSRMVQVDGANSGSKKVPDTLQLCKIQEESASLAAKHLAQHAAANLIIRNNSLLEAARLTNSGPCHIQSTSKGLMNSDRLHPFESQDCLAALARPSGLRLPSPSLRLFDLRTTSESNSLKPKKNQQYIGSDRKYGELWPPATPPMKSNDITENVGCVVQTSSKECCAPATQLHPSPNYMLNTSTKGVGIKLEYECMGSEQEKRVLGHEEIAAARTGGKGITLSRPTEQLAGHVGTCHQLMSEGRVPETKHKFVLHNEGDVLQSYTASSMSTFGQSIQHQEETISTAVDNLAQTSLEQADTEKFDDALPKVNSESRLDAGTQVFVESQEREGFRKIEDDVGTAKCVPAGRKHGEPWLPTRPPMKNNDITENVGCVVLTSSNECCVPAIHLTPSANYMLNTNNKRVPDSNVYQNLVTKVVPRVGIKLDYECMGSEQEKRILGHEEIAATWKGGEGITVSHTIEQLAGHVGTCHQLISEGRVPETKHKFVLHNAEDGLKSYTASSMSTFGQSIQHQEETISTGVDDIAQTSWEQADTEKSKDASPKVNAESHLAAGSQVFVESREQDGTRKREDDIETTKCVALGIESYSSMLQHGQENDVSKVVDDRSLPMDEDGSPCSMTLSIWFGDSHSLEDEAHGTKLKCIDTSSIPFQNMNTKQGNDDVDGVDDFSTTTSPRVRDPSAEEGTQLHNSPARDTVTQLLNDSPSVEGFNNNEPTPSLVNKHQLPVALLLHDNPSYTQGMDLIPTNSIKTESQLQDTGTANGSIKCFEATTPCISKLLNSQLSVSCTTAEESSCLEEGTFHNVTDINDNLSKLKSVSSALLIKVPCQKQDGVDVDLSQEMGVFEVAEKLQDSGRGNILEAKSTPELCCLVGGGDESSVTKTTYMIETKESMISIGEQVDATPIVGGFQHELDDLKDHKDATVLTKRSNSIKRQDNYLVIPPSNAVPFSDEWLAAFEAAGEEILTMKCGAVQHSPQDKSVPEPSPWSPVKKKTNQIGPFDCTKYTNGSQVSDQ